MIIQAIDNLVSGRNIVLAGYGREGKALLDWLILHYPNQIFSVADRQELPDASFPQRHHWIGGTDSMSKLSTFDLIIKTPGIPSAQLAYLPSEKITSQTELFLRAYGPQTLGITGTKGKSTTTSLVYHILKTYTDKVVLTGNIGIPPFTVVDQLDPATAVVMELSAHQLELVKHCPHISVLLNLFEEHLDHFSDYNAYQEAKYNIARYHRPGDYLIYPSFDETVGELLKRNSVTGVLLPFGLTRPEGEGIWLEGDNVYLKLPLSDPEVICKGVSRSPLSGSHNRLNIMAAAAVAALYGVGETIISCAVSTFSGLPHRLEFVGIYGEVKFYDDSISTIPEAVIAAVKSLGRVDVLLLGGFDRGISYDKLASFIPGSGVKLILLTGPAGERIQRVLIEAGVKPSQMQFHVRFDDMVKMAVKSTVAGDVVLMSPGASSYDQFKNFEERGKRYKEIIKEMADLNLTVN